MSIRDDDFQNLYNAAWAAGVAAVAKDIKYTGDTSIDGWWRPHDMGACGFGWVIFKPGTKAFAKWMVKNSDKLPGRPRKDSYYGGVCIWIGDYNQSVHMKSIHAAAMAKVFREAGYELCYAADRLD